MGDRIYYTFSIHPADLLKISYVSHRMKGFGSDSMAYQRMIKKSRLSSIKQYISEGGVFPTNVVANLNHKPQFDVSEQDARHSGLSRFGWLTLQPKYKSAWIIDGQHRLYAYSGHEAAASDYLSILAFEELDEATQANMFVDINSKQKSVPPAVLNALYSELHWHSDDPKDRSQAVVSRAVQRLGTAQAESPFFGRILKEETSRDPYVSLTITALCNKLNASRFFFERKRGSRNMSFGPFWFEADNLQMVRRIETVLDRWFGVIRDHNEEWWELGKAPGGGLCMNDSVVAHLDVLMVVFDYLKDERKFDWLDANQTQLADAIEPFAHSIGEFLAQKDEAARREYRSYRGTQGQTYLSRSMQAHLREHFDNFNPLGLDEFLESQKVENKTRAKELLDELELLIKSTVIEVLKDEYPDGDDWWLEGVPAAVRTDVSKRREEDKRAGGAEENYLYLIQYYDIITKKWGLFESLFSLGSSNRKKEDRIAWLKDINTWRNVVSHPTTGKGISAEQVHQIEEIVNGIKEKINGSRGDIDQ
jgi:DNA sulfur modification protein DndB